MNEIQLDQDIFEKLKRDAKYKKSDASRLANQILREELFRSRKDRRDERKEKEQRLKEIPYNCPECGCSLKKGREEKVSSLSWWQKLWNKKS